MVTYSGQVLKLPCFRAQKAFFTIFIWMPNKSRIVYLVYLENASVKAFNRGNYFFFLKNVKADNTKTNT